ncbi:glycosyltransferase [Sphingomonas ginkgonis]|uniref:Glycosyltransferase n=1 Tax=Sphingomonas ginkgonis TaxID=2315330 RepID=A0A3R9YMY4_9SPHN|nr:glycosyltransferase [Sphingomonas ginkgonis]RST31443.1 glycosyltransferase [Sphingomonas ginkgonis]
MGFQRKPEPLRWNETALGEALVPWPRGENRPRRIVHVITRLLLAGAEENTMATCLHQARCGDRVTLIHGPGAEPSWAERYGAQIDFLGCDALVHPIDPLADLRATLALHSIYRRLRPDVVHTHGSKAGIVGRLAAASAGVPLIVHTIHIAPFLAVGPVTRCFYVAAERLCARLSHLLIAVSGGMQRAYLDARIGDGVAIPVVHSGMPLERFVAAAPPGDWHARIGGWDGAVRPRFLLKLASFEKRKRQVPLVQALAAGLRERPDVCLLLAGDGPERARCEAEIQALGLARQVRCLGHDPAPWELVAMADLCVHAAEREGLPRSAVQAIAGGKPLLVARLPGIEEIIEDGVNGLVADADDLADLATRLFALLDSPGQLARLQGGARRTDVSSWREEMMGERIDRAYAGAKRSQDAPAATPVTAIEFFGLPAAGKTAIARELRSLLRHDRGSIRFSRELMGDEQGFARRSLRRLAQLLATFARRPGLAALGTASLTSGHGSWRDRLKTRWNYLSVLAMQLRRHRHGLLIADQGIVQSLWTARVQHGGDVAPLDPIARRAGDWIARTLFVQVDAPSAIAQERLRRRTRHWSRFQDADRIDDPQVWASGVDAVARLQRELTTALAERGLHDHWVRIGGHGNDTPRDRARRLRDHLLRLEHPPA